MNSGIFTVFGRRRVKVPPKPSALEERAWRGVGNVDWRGHAAGWDGKTALVARATGGGKERRK
jgi:hypothetical protein